MIGDVFIQNTVKLNYPATVYGGNRETKLRSHDLALMLQQLCQCKSWNLLAVHRSKSRQMPCAKNSVQ